MALRASFWPFGPAWLRPSGPSGAQAVWPTNRSIAHGCNQHQHLCSVEHFQWLLLQSLLVAAIAITSSGCYRNQHLIVEFRWTVELPSLNTRQVEIILRSLALLWFFDINFDYNADHLSNSVSMQATSTHWPAQRARSGLTFDSIFFTGSIFSLLHNVYLVLTHLTKNIMFQCDWLLHFVFLQFCQNKAPNFKGDYDLGKICLTLQLAKPEF